MMLPQEAANLGQSLVFPALIQGWAHLLRIHPHTAKLVDVERTAKATDTLLLEDGGIAILSPHHHVTKEKQRGEHDQADCRDEAILHPFHVTFERTHPIWDISVICNHKYFVFELIRGTAAHRQKGHKRG